MSDATCKTCPFFDAAPKAAWGQCRNAPPVYDVASGESEWPRTDDNAFCGAHPLRQRDRLAAMAMQGMLADPNVTAPENVAKFAYLIADAMLTAAAEGTATP